MTQDNEYITIPPCDPAWDYGQRRKPHPTTKEEILAKVAELQKSINTIKESLPLERQKAKSSYSIQQNLMK